MRKLSGIVAVFITLIALIIVAPFICGLSLQHNFYHVLALYSSNQNLRAQLISYKRHWLFSDATISLEIINPKIIDTFTAMGVAAEDVPKKIIIEQHIQHGPLFFHSVAGLPAVFGLAAIQNKLQLSPQVIKFFQQLGMNNNFVFLNNDLISFTGKFYNYFKLSVVDKIYPESHVQIKIASLEGHLWIWPVAPRISGDLSLHTLEVSDGNDSLTVPFITLQFDQQQNKDHLWLGNSALLIPEINWLTAEGDHSSLKGLDFNGTVNEVAGMLNASRQFDITQLQMNDQDMGPIHLQIEANKIDSKALVKLVQAYQEIMHRGELYQSQLKQKMLLMLPSLVVSGTKLKLAAMDIKTPVGKLQMNGDLAWKMDTASIPDDVGELIEAGDGQMHLRVSKALLDKCIQLSATLSFLSPPTPDIQNAYWAARKELNRAIDHNNYIIEVFAQNHLVPESNAIVLMQLVQKAVPLGDYAAELRGLLFDRSISLVTGYWLFWQYLAIERPLILMTSLERQYQEAISGSLHEQLNGWIKDGYVIDDKNDYVVSIKQELGKVNINGHALSAN